MAELAELAARALAEEGVRAASGRVTEVPDARLIRWYTTIGLLDRPTIGAGRLARYGVRHLLQLVAVKRLQAQGLPLAQIQQRLTGATDDQLRSVAALPPGVGDRDGDVGDRPAPADLSWPAAGRFWVERPAGVGSAKVATGVDDAGNTVTRAYGVRLGDLTLLLPAEPAPHDLPDIAAAARPLLDLLASRDLLRERTENRGLLDPTEGARR